MLEICVIENPAVDFEWRTISDNGDYPVEEFENAFLKMFPHISEDDIIDARIFKTRYSQPVVECDYSKKMPHITTSEKGFFTVGMAQIYPEDRGINYAIRSGYEAAQAALDDK